MLLFGDKREFIENVVCKKSRLVKTEREHVLSTGQTDVCIVDHTRPRKVIARKKGIW